MYTPVNPSFTIQKWGLRGSKLYRHVYVMFKGPFHDTFGQRTEAKFRGITIACFFLLLFRFFFLFSFFFLYFFCFFAVKDKLLLSITNLCHVDIKQNCSNTYVIFYSLSTVKTGQVLLSVFRRGLGGRKANRNSEKGVTLVHHENMAI